MKKLLLNYQVLIIVIILLFFAGCKKNEPAKVAVLSTSASTNITATTATTGGTITSDGGAKITANGVCWSKVANPSLSDSKTTDATGTSQFVSTITSLDAGTAYHVRAYATNAVGTAYGADLSFTTQGQVPSVVSQPATNLAVSGATLNGTVNPNYLSATVTFEYGATTSYGSTATAAQSPVTGNTMVNVSADITGLLSGTTYHFRIKTVNSIGTTYSEDKTFTTVGQTPIVTTLDATNKTITGATLNATVNANNLSATVTFEYGTTTNYGQTITAAQSPVTGNTVTSVSAVLTGLTAGTTYHFRVKAVNSVGITLGDDKSFPFYSVPPTIGLIGYWPFSGNANDGSGNGHNGTVNGASLTTDRFNSSNSAYSFNGLNNYINLGNLGGYTSHSFSGWFKIGGQQNGWGVLVSKLYNDLYAFMNSEIRIDPDAGAGYKLSCQVGSGSEWVGPLMNNTISSTEWHHFVFIYDNTAKTVTAYIDNSIFGTATVSGYSDSALTPTYVGARPYWNGPIVFFFNGKIDDVRIYNRALTNLEIQALFHEGGW